jgi:hypothetical protein
MVPFMTMSDWIAAAGIFIQVLLFAGLIWYCVETRRIRIAAGKQADAAIASTEALRSSERAWIMVDIEKQPGAVFLTEGTGVDSTGKKSFSTGAFVRCVCRNLGKTPARISETRICLLAGIKPLPKEPNLAIPISDAEPHYLQSGDESKHDWTIDGEGGAGITNMVVIYGVVKYQHIFSDQEVQTTFGYRVTVDNKLERLTGYPEYNKNT